MGQELITTLKTVEGRKKKILTWAHGATVVALSQQHVTLHVSFRKYVACAKGHMYVCYITYLSPGLVPVE